jgi:hypothetical protein
MLVFMNMNNSADHHLVRVIGQIGPANFPAQLWVEAECVWVNEFMEAQLRFHIKIPFGSGLIPVSQSILEWVGGWFAPSKCVRAIPPHPLVSWRSWRTCVRHLFQPCHLTQLAQLAQLALS